MRGQGRRIVGVAAFVLLLLAFAAPTMAYAADVADPSAASVQPVAGDDTVIFEPAATEAAAVDNAGAGEVSPDAAAPCETADSVPVQAADGAAEAPESPTSGATDDQSGSGSQISSQANPDTRAVIESALKARKRQFDITVTTLQRSIDQLAAMVRRLDAADVNTSVARARLAEARLALARAKAAERTAVARFRSVLSAEDESVAYASARASARVSSAQLERARVKVLTAAKTLRAIVKNVTV